jgi:putative PIN family toxin of toxin-antitoxin system
VLDTNVVVSALLFAGGRPAQLRAAWQAGAFVPLASAATVNELVRVLAYPKFKLAPAERDELLADYLPWIEAVRIPEPPPRVPACRDAADAMFLHLAVAGGATCLVSGDRDLLSMAGSRGLCPVLGVEAFCRQVLER